MPGNLVRTCKEGQCPQIYEEDDGTLLVQGYRVEEPELLDRLRLPEGESVVRVPRALVIEAVRLMSTEEGPWARN